MDAGESDFAVATITAFDEQKGDAKYYFLVAGADYVLHGTWSVSVLCIAEPDVGADGSERSVQQGVHEARTARLFEAAEVRRGRAWRTSSRATTECLEKKQEKLDSGCCVSAEYASKGESAK